MPPCNCGKNRPKPAPKPSGSMTTSQEFSLQVNGRTQTFGSKLERDAAQIRATRIIK